MTGFEPCCLFVPNHEQGCRQRALSTREHHLGTLGIAEEWPCCCTLLLHAGKSNPGALARLIAHQPRVTSTPTARTVSRVVSWRRRRQSAILPWLADVLNLSPAVTGAWIGGNIDTTAAVAAAGSIAGEDVLALARDREVDPERSHRRGGNRLDPRISRSRSNGGRVLRRPAPARASGGSPSSCWGSSPRPSSRRSTSMRAARMANPEPASDPRDVSAPVATLACTATVVLR